MSATTLNYRMVKRLILKDWYLQRWPIAAYLPPGALGVALLAFGGQGFFYAGTILLATLLIILGIHFPLATVVYERKEQVLPFVITLPVSWREYTAAKVLANFGLFLGIFLVIGGASLVVMSLRTGIPGGTIPFMMLVMLELLCGACLLLMTAITTSSLAWTVGVSVCLDLFFQGYLFWLGRLPGIASQFEKPHAIWNSTVANLFLGEVGLIAVLILISFLVPARKRDLL
jgi:ABC-2 type transport system permease protein